MKRQDNRTIIHTQGGAPLLVIKKQPHKCHQWERQEAQAGWRKEGSSRGSAHCLQTGFGSTEQQLLERFVEAVSLGKEKIQQFLVENLNDRFSIKKRILQQKRLGFWELKVGSWDKIYDWNNQELQHHETNHKGQEKKTTQQKKKKNKLKRKDGRIFMLEHQQDSRLCATMWFISIHFKQHIRW